MLFCLKSNISTLLNIADCAVLPFAPGVVRVLTFYAGEKIFLKITFRILYLLVEYAHGVLSGSFGLI